ncbi:MBL fold metallo-hydrolase [Salipiger bermudensis]|uniref:Metallo-beta-lactamase family protein n=1 Tax=Salipiger bermudensis (strain DSM 26914 / JCM 13377 / KCTC 12554 / HTCC2601) TaxID=314265 RepID=Q0FHV3_SALBH|nr:MBL fold metallo-hydrolase [Salipiger bermudensis]EAU43764.1 metallo-beta-lactamase family protein [Salipiger bermudensis HTCC2601]
MQDPQPDFQPLAGAPETLAPGLRRIVAPNASPMTYRGTNTYLVGRRGLAVIDPGPMLEAHLDAILAAVTLGQRITHILVTHAHLDHSPLARPLSEATGAPVLAFGDAASGRSEAMQALAESGMVGGGEGVDAGFAPDQCLADGARVAGDGWQLEALHTPGHFGNHLSFAWDDMLFSGDVVMGWASSLVSPPDGDLTAFMTSLSRLAERRWSRFHPGHGAPVDAPAERLSDLRDHRLMREAQILSALGSGASDATSLAARIYTDTPAALLPAATRNVLAHLLDLQASGRARVLTALSEKAMFEVT